MNRRFTRTFAVIMMIMAGMTACGQKKNVTTDTFETENNFTGVKIYDFTDAYLRYGTVKKL